MSVKNVLGVKTPGELTRCVHGRFIMLTARGISVSVLLTDWNRLGIEALI
ncbi:MAG: hypothetical protein ACI4WS_02635 [Oscillospiraceae bacterium]